MRKWSASLSMVVVPQERQSIGSRWTGEEMQRETSGALAAYKKTIATLTSKR